jgi:hypothetical protein
MPYDGFYGTSAFEFAFDCGGYVSALPGYEDFGIGDIMATISTVNEEMYLHRYGLYHDRIVAVVKTTSPK